MGRYEGAWWSPDGKLLAFEEADTRSVETFSLGDPAHPEAGVQQLPYPRPGKSNAKVRVGLVPAAGGKPSWVKWDAERYPYLTQVKWPGRGALTLYVMDRAQQHAQLLAVDPKTGATHVLLEEQDSAWLNLEFVGGGRRANPLPLWLPDGSAFFWVTERNGAPEAEIRGADGKRLGSWVRPDQQLVRILGYDATEHALYYQASPESPDLVVMRVRDGGNPERVVGQIGERVIVSGMLAEDGPTRLVSIETPTSFAELVGLRPRRPLRRAAPIGPGDAAADAGPGVPEAGSPGLLVLRAAAPRRAPRPEAAHHRLDLRRAARQPRAVERQGVALGAVARRPGLPGGGLRQPRDAAARAGLGARHPRRPRRAHAGGPGGGAPAPGAAGSGAGPRPGGHHRLVVRRLRLGAGGAEAAGRLPRRRWRARR